MKTFLPESLQQFRVFLLQLVGILFTASCTRNQRWLIGLGICPGGALLGSALQVVMGFVLSGRRWLRRSVRGWGQSHRGLATSAVCSPNRVLAKGMLLT